MCKSVSDYSVILTESTEWSSIIIPNSMRVVYRRGTMLSVVGVRSRFQPQ